MKNGIILLDKDENITSRAIDNKIGKILGIKKVGHLGTLDPFATGLLLVGVGKGTKYFPYLPDSRKTYVATLKLGQKTDTGDLTGEVVETKDVSELTLNIVKNILNSFIGKQKQIPPIYSAKKKNGVAMYKYARKGIEVEREPVDIEIFMCELLSINNDEITFVTEVSKGTYIRTLGEDIAEKLNTVGHLISLRRIKIGDISVENAIKIEDIDENSLIDPSKYLTLPSHEVDEETCKKVKNGMTIKLERISYDEVVLSYEGVAIAVYYKDGNYYRCQRGLF